MNLKTFLQAVDILEQNLPENSPADMLKNSYKRNPYTILMVTLLSLRSKDERTAKVANKLFCDIQTPRELLKLPLDELENIIKPIGFQKQKAKILREISKILLEIYDGRVPKDKKELLSIKGIGEKTANIVLNNAFDTPAIAVDVHVHRLCNMWGVIKTKDEKESSKLLNQIIPKEYKSKLNHILVSFGQTVCLPNRPKCEKCPIGKLCYNY